MLDFDSLISAARKRSGARICRFCGRELAILLLLLVPLLAPPALAADCATREEMERRLAGFQPIGFGFAGDGRMLEVWVNGARVAYFMRLDARRRTACIVSPRIQDFNWLTVMPPGTAS